MRKSSIAILIYGAPGSNRNAFTEEKYKKLAAYLIEKGSQVHSVSYHDSVADKLENELLHQDAILVWVNPIEQGNDRKILDGLLEKLSDNGVFVSAHPDVILKIGTKEILYKVKDEEFGTDVKLYHSFDSFRQKFLLSAGQNTRILKQYRGNGGNGVFKIDATKIDHDNISVTHATSGDQENNMSVNEFFSSFEMYFKSGSMLIDQEWNPNIINGMVRCYLSGSKVAGFGYQEVNALYPVMNGAYKKPSQRFYYSEDCGLFRDLKKIMEENWVMRLQDITKIENDMLPVIWDADFFINDINTENTAKKYSLCEINVSSVSPFPESAIPYIAEEVNKRIRTK